MGFFDIRLVRDQRVCMHATTSLCVLDGAMLLNMKDVMWLVQGAIQRHCITINVSQNGGLSVVCDGINAPHEQNL
jgi:hypothetical protein